MQCRAHSWGLYFGTVSSWECRSHFLLTREANQALAYCLQKLLRCHWLGNLPRRQSSIVIMKRVHWWHASASLFVLKGQTTLICLYYHEHTVVLCVWPCTLSVGKVCCHWSEAFSLHKFATCVMLKCRTLYKKNETVFKFFIHTQPHMLHRCLKLIIMCIIVRATFQLHPLSLLVHAFRVNISWKGRVTCV